MAKFQPLFATDKTAAQLLELTTSEFLALVEAGALPGPILIGPKVQRWAIKDLEAVGSGAAFEEAFQW